MKYLLLATTLLASFASCSKKEAEPAPTPTIEGTWMYVSQMTVATPLLTPGPDIISGANYGAMELLLTLSSPTLGKSQYTIKGQLDLPRAYSYIGDELTIQGVNYPSAYTVVTLTATDFVFSETTRDVGHRYVVSQKLTRLK
jgi:hypothetical protein